MTALIDNDRIPSRPQNAHYSSASRLLSGREGAFHRALDGFQAGGFAEVTLDAMGAQGVDPNPGEGPSLKPIWV